MTMNLKLNVTTGGVAPGTYKGTFQGFAQIQNDYGDGLEWCFALANGQQLKRITRDVPTLKNSCGKMIAGITGQGLATGEVDLAQFVGKPYTLIVAPTANGGSRIETVVPA
ncbi:MAG: hypothetical protein JNM56_30510 [Planctomycetia bacterium]|nr:hypothetical protein [Planctomycetia bacterium]